MVINTLGNRQGWGRARLGRAAVSRRVVWESPAEKRPEGGVSLIIHVSLADCVGNRVRHCGGSPESIPIL